MINTTDGTHTDLVRKTVGRGALFFRGAKAWLIAPGYRTYDQIDLWQPLPIGINVKPDFLSSE